ncbi:hypothetical protein [Aquimarina spongiae]|uniref:DUF4468 domain-containing protein n=1 Tax=Aquimarina spongiae TaxID=570521 RepID=A0A1M6I631_9FLAO|nr:hypothetical protein [Aquimarina spongiae]SHJ29861.1 hypothetical protein SAMN04488508_107138 [Aquimarina spongiae]
MRALIVIGSLFITMTSSAQYLDFPGMFMRGTERNKVREWGRQMTKTTTAYTSTVAPTATIMAAKERYFFTPGITIKYDDYSDICNGYIGFKSRGACNNKKNYLIYAHKRVLYLLLTTTKNRVNVGVMEQIEEKYVSITNTIYKELEAMKREAERKILYRLLSKN